MDADLIGTDGERSTRQTVDWGSLIWPHGRPSGGIQVLDDRRAAEAAIARRAADPVAERGPIAVADLADVADMADPADVVDVIDAADRAEQDERDERYELDWREFPEVVRNRPTMVRTEPVEVVEDEPETAPWSPEATYESLVKLLGELRALQPQEVMVLPRTAGRGAVRRRPWKLIAGVTAATVVVAGVGFFAFQHHRGAHHAAVTAAPHMSTVLVVLADGLSVEGATLLAHEPGQTQEILLPSRLLVDIPGQGSAPLAGAMTSGSDAPAAAIEDALMVRVDGEWILQPADLAKLVDAVGGVTVSLTPDLLPPSGATTLPLVGGANRFTGAQAAAFAGVLGAQEPEASRLARQQILLEAILSKLPASTARIQTLLQANDVTAGMTTSALASLLAGARADVLDNQAASTLVPTNEIDTGQAAVSYGLDDAGTATMVAQRLAGAELPTPAGGRLRVLVQNGIGTPGLGDRARQILVPRGYQFRTGGNTTSFSDGPSVVLIPDSSAQSQAEGDTVARLLGLPNTDVELDPSPTTIADVIVILGSDFQGTGAASAAASAGTGTGASSAPTASVPSASTAP